MTWGAVASAGATIVGGMMSGDTAQGAGQQQATMTAEQAQAIRDSAKWTPIGTTNRFGSSTQTVDPTTGQLTNASWNLSPEMKAWQERLAAGSNEAMPASLNAEAATLKQYEMLKNQQAPGVERGYSGLLSNLVNKGTIGLSTGGTEGIGGTTAMRQSQPEMEAYYNALAQQDARNLSQAQTTSRALMDSDIARSTGMMNQSYAIDDRAQAYLKDTLGWSDAQRDAAMRAATAAAGPAADAAGLQAGVDSYDPFGSLLSGLGSNPNTGKVITGLFGGSSPSAPGVPTQYTGGGFKMPADTSKFNW